MHDRNNSQGGATPRGVKPHIVIPPSQILRVAQPTDDYIRCVGWLLTDKQASYTWGTGTIVTAGGNYGILTAAHNVYDTATGAAGTNAVFVPALTQGKLGNVAIAVGKEAIYIPADYRGNERGPKDYAIIALKAEQVPDVCAPYPTMQKIPVADLATVQVTGYPSSPPKTGDLTPAMYYGCGPGVTSTDPTFLWYRASTLHGMSGGGVCRVDPDGGVPDVATITGVHVGGVDTGDPATSYNKAVYLTDAIIRELAAKIVPSTT